MLKSKEVHTLSFIALIKFSRNLISFGKSSFWLVLLILVMIFTPLISSPVGIAQEQVCNRDPGEERGIATIRSNSATVRGYILKIQLRYKKQTEEKWVRACIPAGTRLYLKDREGREYGAYIAQVHGWNYADKVISKESLSACAKHPEDPREFCTRPG